MQEQDALNSARTLKNFEGFTGGIGSVYFQHFPSFGKNTECKIFKRWYPIVGYPFLQT